MLGSGSRSSPCRGRGKKEAEKACGHATGEQRKRSQGCGAGHRSIPLLDRALRGSCTGGDHIAGLENARAADRVIHVSDETPSRFREFDYRLRTRAPRAAAQSSSDRSTLAWLKLWRLTKL